MDLNSQALGQKPEGGGTAADRVYDSMRLRILELKLKPDDTLSRANLARDYAVSQTPVREALQRLEQDGLIRVFPQSRTVVARIDENQLNESHLLRVGVETEVVRRVAALEDRAATVQRARGLVRMQEALIEDPSQTPLFNELDRAFHRSLFDAIGVGALHTMVARKMGHLARCQQLELPRKGKMSEIVHGHMAIVEGIASGDPEKAANAMRGHISGTIRRISTLKDEFPQYFELAG